MRPEFRDINWLRGNHQMIHYFGLGFIQLKIDDTYRMHFYTRKLPAIVSHEDVHNHRYDFVSTVMYGWFRQEIYQIIEGDTHVREKESCKAGVEVHESGILCGIKLLTRQRFGQGSNYFLDHGTFHKVIDSNACVTVIKRSEYKKELAEVVRLKGEEKICPFSHKVEVDQLWEIVEDLLRTGE